MTKSLEEIALEETVGVEAAQKFIQHQDVYQALAMVKELGAEKYKQAYNYLLDKMQFGEHLDRKESVSRGMRSIFESCPGGLLFYKELANELAKPEGKRDEEKIRSSVGYFDSMIGKFLDSYYDAEARAERR